MSKLIQCPACQRQFKARAELAGKSVKCPGCGESFHVFASDVDDLFGEADASFEPSPALPIVAKSRSPISASPRPAASASMVAEAKQSPAPPAKPASTDFGILKKKQPAPLWAKLVSFGTVIGMIGLFALLLPLIGLQLKIMDLFGDYERSGAIALLLIGGAGVGAGLLLKPK